jgi:hypothetical protein
MRGMLVVFCLFAAARLPGLSLPEEWDFGFSDDANPLRHSLAAKNDEAVPLSLRFVSPCGCLTIEPSKLSLMPGQSADVVLAFDPAGYFGGVAKTILVRIEGRADRRIVVRGTVFSSVRASIPSHARECALCPDQSRVVRFYFSADCGSCSQLLETEVPRVAKALGREILVNRRDIWSLEILRELSEILSVGGLELTALPVLVIGKAVLQGEPAIRSGFETERRTLLRMTEQREE